MKFMEENHVHLEATGESFETVYQEAYDAYGKLELEYCYDNQIGFLTTQPDTTGCGLKLEATIKVRKL